MQLDRAGCQRCGACTQACPAQALVLIGRRVTVSELLPELQADREFHAISGGGVTISGGEPLMQAEFSKELAATCRRTGLDVVLDTSGHGHWEDLQAIVRHCSLVLYDIKSLDPERHRSGTGVDNTLILENAGRIVEYFGAERMILRYPLVPGSNDRAEDFRALAKLATKLKVAVDVLPYHRLGTGKYDMLGLEPPSEQPDIDIAAAATTELCRQLQAQGVTCRVG